MTGGPGARVLVLGLDPFRVPGPWDPEPVAAAIEEGRRRFAEHAVAVDYCLVGLDGSDDVEAVVTRALRARDWECVVVGGGISGGTGLLEQVLNLLRRHAPGAAIALGTSPSDAYDAAARWLGPTFTDPQVILFVADCERAAAFYRVFGFDETFRSPDEPPIKVEMTLGGFALGLALPGPAADSHGLQPVTAGHRACLTLWTDDVEAAYQRALAAGGVDSRAPHPFRDGLLRVAFVEDPDGHPVQLAQRLRD